MAYTTINKSTDYFNTKLYTGTGSSNAITGVGFQPDFTWIKDRDATNNHSLYDAVRGVTKVILSNATNAETTYAQGLTAFGTDGFTVGTDSQNNTNGNDICSWNWKAGTTGSGSTTGSGTSKTYNYSVNTTSRFSITKYTGNGNGGHTVPHSLGTTPTLIMAKELGASDYWRVYHPALTANHNLYLNTTHAQDSASDGYLAAPNATNITFGGSSNTNTVNQDGIDYIAYCFADVAGYSKFGSYVGNNNSTFVYTGFKPKFLLLKNASEANGWLVLDAERTTSNPMGAYVYANTTGAEGTVSYIDFLSNGFRLVSTSSVAVNKSGNTFIYAAFGQSLVGSNNIPCTAR